MERQERLFNDFCRLHELTPLPEVYADRGLSGYHDQHRKKGALGRLVQQAKGGCFEPGTVIVVEAWDRLGRLRPDKQTELIAELLRTGVHIGVCGLNDIFKEEDFGTHKWTTLAVFVQLAYQESKQKADRIASSWVKRRKKAREDGTLVNKCLPAWLEVAGGKPRPIPERVAALKLIFRLAADGFGQVRIVRALAEGTLTEGQGKARTARQLPGGKVPPFGTRKWSRTYLNKILCDRRVLGEYQPRKADGTPDGPVIPSYFPQVISESEYLLARAGQDKNEYLLARDGQEKRRGRGFRDRRYVNVFRGLLVHARDGEGFVLTNHGEGKRPQLVLATASSKEGRGARTYTFPYPVFETAILGCLAELDPRELLPREAGPGPVEVLRARLGNARAKVSQLQEELRDGGFSKTLAAVLREQEALEEKLAAELLDEEARAARPVEKAWGELPGLVGLIAAGGDEVRLKLRALLRGIVDQIYVLTDRRGGRILGAAQVRFVGGGHREYLIDYRVAGHNRTGRWRVSSFRNPWGLFHPESDCCVGYVSYDLGDPEGVEKVLLLLPDSDEGLEEAFRGCPWYPLPGEEGPADRGVYPTPEPLTPSVSEYRGPLGREDQPEGGEAPTPSADADGRVHIEIVSTDPEVLLDTVLDHEVAERMLCYDKDNPGVTPATRTRNAKRLRREVLEEVASGQFRRESLAPAPGSPAPDADWMNSFNGLMDLLEPVARQRLGGK
jgi:DNA invertase Pin-like site-specific DNA recombinase